MERKNKYDTDNIEEIIKITKEGVIIQWRIIWGNIMMGWLFP